MEVFLLAFTTLFVTVGPVDVAVVFGSLSANQSQPQRLALVSVLVAGGILLFFALVGDLVLGYLGISVSSLRIAGGILLLLTSIDLVFNAHSDTTSVSKADTKEAKQRSDLAIFPIAMPLLAGPSAITSLIVLMADGDLVQKGQVLAALAAIMLLTYLSMLVSRQVASMLGRSGLNVFSRLMGLLLAALATQFVVDGIKTSGLLA